MYYFTNQKNNTLQISYWSYKCLSSESARSNVPGTTLLTVGHSGQGVLNVWWDRAMRAGNAERATRHRWGLCLFQVLGRQDLCVGHDDQRRLHPCSFLPTSSPGPVTYLHLVRPILAFQAVCLHTSHTSANFTSGEVRLREALTWLRSQSSCEAERGDRALWCQRVRPFQRGPVSGAPPAAQDGWAGRLPPGGCGATHPSFPEARPSA